MDIMNIQNSKRNNLLYIDSSGVTTYRVFTSQFNDPLIVRCINVVGLTGNDLLLATCR